MNRRVGLPTRCSYQLAHQWRKACWGLLVLGLVFPGFGVANAAAPQQPLEAGGKEIKMQPLFPAIADEIVQMRETDQAMRKRAMSTGSKMDPEVDARNTQRMKEIVQQIGWPTKSKVGGAAAYGAWLLVQHADREGGFQAQCLKLMKEAPPGEVEKANIAYLEDRVRVNIGRPQLYGTQFHTDKDGTFGPRPIEDPDNLERRRKEMGLRSFAEYAATMQKLNSESSGKKPGEAGKPE
jgi:hypothetical protein